MRHRSLVTLLRDLVALAATVAACGDDDEGASAATRTPSTTTAPGDQKWKEVVPGGDCECADYVEDSVVNRELHRLFVRESLADTVGGNVGQPIGVDERYVADLRRRQKRGKLTGLDPASPEFAERYGEQLRLLVRRLA